MGCFGFTRLLFLFSKHPESILDTRSNLAHKKAARQEYPYFLSSRSGRAFPYHLFQQTELAC